MITKANALGNLGITLADMTPYGGNGANRPATGISWNEAARFINWLDTSTGSPPAYKFAVQPGDPGYSSNSNIQLWTPSDPGYIPNNPYRNSLAHYFLPSVDEWYKAAFYDPIGGVYYDYATGSDSAPAAVASGTAPGTAVYNQPANLGPADITLAGGSSPYGTLGQSGNVYEWDETSYFRLNNSVSDPRGRRGGYWMINSYFISSSFRSNALPTDELISYGFRAANAGIPEPSSLLLGVVAGIGLLLRRTKPK
jgi:formylglycine-generating enzyme required for sulfatase activity